MQPLKAILLAEDDPRDAKLTMTALADNGLANEVALARDGAETLDYLRREGAFADRPAGNPVVVLLDLKMPKVDGVEVLRQMKADERLRLVPVVILTSSREAKDLQRCYELGANCYVVKPVQFADFVRAVKDLSLLWAVLNEPPPGSAPRPRPAG